MKLDLHELVLEKLDWDDKIPNNLRPIWGSHFQMMNEIKTLKHQRAVIPEDAIDTKVNILDFGDARREIACIAVYVGYKRKDGSYSCQLVFARSRLIPTKNDSPTSRNLCSIYQYPSSIHYKGDIPVTSSNRLSNYILDPNKSHFCNVIRIVALVIKFLNLLKSTKINKAHRKSKGLEIATDIEIQSISEKDIDLAEDYYFKKASLEVKNFVKEAQYTKFSKEKDGKLLYTRRILTTNSTSITDSMTNAMQDLSAATFCVPLADKHSPLAYAIIHDIMISTGTIK